MASLVVAGDTSGSVTIAAPAVASTPTLTLPTVSGTFITTASSGQVIPKAALPTGSVLQVVQGSTSTSMSTTSSSFVDTNLTASITPTSSTSKILVIVNQSEVYKQGSASGGTSLQIVRNSTVLANFGLFLGYNASASVSQYFNASGAYLDSPATTSSTTYKTQIAAQNGTTSGAQGDSSTSTITLLEIAA